MVVFPPVFPVKWRKLFTHLILRVPQLSFSPGFILLGKKSAPAQRDASGVGCILAEVGVHLVCCIHGQDVHLLDSSMCRRMGKVLWGSSLEGRCPEYVR